MVSLWQAKHFLPNWWSIIGALKSFVLKNLGWQELQSSPAFLMWLSEEKVTLSIELLAYTFISPGISASALAAHKTNTTANNPVKMYTCFFMF